MFSYRSVLGSAWTITKQHKKLWIFGFLAFLLSAGGEYQILTKILNEDYGAGVYEKMQNGSVFLTPSFWSDLCQVCYTQPKVGFGIVLLLLLMGGLAFVILWLCIKSQVALVKWSKFYVGAKNKDKTASFWTEIFTRDRKFWPVLGLNITVKVLISLLFLLLSLPLIFLYFKDSNFAILIYTLFFIVFLPIAISVSLIVKYAIAYNVLEKQTYVKSLESAYALFRKNWLVSLEMAIALFLINFLAGLIVMFVISVFLLPIILTLIIFNALLPLYIITVLAFLILVVSAAILMTFQTSTWTILYLELKGKGAEAKLERIFKKKTGSKKAKK